MRLQLNLNSDEAMVLNLIFNNEGSARSGSVRSDWFVKAHYTLQLKMRKMQAQRQAKIDALPVA